MRNLSRARGLAGPGCPPQALPDVQCDIGVVNRVRRVQWGAVKVEAAGVDGMQLEKSELAGRANRRWSPAALAAGYLEGLGEAVFWPARRPKRPRGLFDRQGPGHRFWYPYDHRGARRGLAGLSASRRAESEPNSRECGKRKSRERAHTPTIRASHGTTTGRPHAKVKDSYQFAPKRARSEGRPRLPTMPSHELLATWLSIGDRNRIDDDGFLPDRLDGHAEAASSLNRT